MTTCADGDRAIDEVARGAEAKDRVPPPLGGKNMAFTSAGSIDQVAATM